jgi:hypothetical protein
MQRKERPVKVKEAVALGAVEQSVCTSMVSWVLSSWVRSVWDERVTCDAGFWARVRVVGLERRVGT